MAAHNQFRLNQPEKVGRHLEITLPLVVVRSRLRLIELMLVRSEIVPSLGWVIVLHRLDSAPAIDLIPLH